MPNYTNTRTLLGDQGALDALVSDTLTILADDTVAALRSYALYNRKQLQEVYLPKVRTFPSSGFTGCSALKKIYLCQDSDPFTRPYTTLNADALPGHAVLYVSDAQVSAWRAESRYSGFKDRIFGVSDDGKYEWDDSEIADSWDTILANVQNGTAATAYHLGQYKRLDLFTLGIIEFQIIGINADDLASGSGKAQLTWFPRLALPSASHRMNPQLSGTTPGTGTIGGMAYCEGQTWLDETVFPMIPDAVRAAIKSVRKYTTGYDTSGTLTADMVTNHKLFLPSAREVGAALYHANKETMGPVYSLAFANSDTNKRRNVNGANVVNYSLRTAGSQNSFLMMNSSGSLTTLVAQSQGTLAFGFCT